jgi:hypothetical protein
MGFAAKHEKLVSSSTKSQKAEQDWRTSAFRLQSTDC